MHFKRGLLCLLASILLWMGPSFSGLAQSLQRSYITANDFHLTEPEKQAVVYDLATDSMGFVYLAGPRGIHRFDGNNLVPLHRTKDAFLTFFKDERQHLWVYTWKKLALFKVTYDSLVPYRYNHALENFLGRSVESIYMDKEDLLHLAIKNRGYLTISSKGELTQKVTQATGVHGYVMTRLKNEQLFCYSIRQKAAEEDGQLCNVYYQHKDQSYVKIAQTNESRFQRLPSFVQLDVHKWVLSTGSNCIIAGRDDSLIKKTITPFRVVKLFADAGQNIWAGTYKGGIHRLHPESFHSEEHLFGLESAAVLAKDQQGGMWAQSRKSGFVFFPNPSMLRYSLDSGNFEAFLPHLMYTDYERIYCLVEQGIMVIEDDSLYLLPEPAVIPDQAAPGGIPTTFYADTLNQQFCAASITLLGTWNGKKWRMISLKWLAPQSHKMIGLHALGKDELMGVSTKEIIRISKGEATDIIRLPRTDIGITSFAVSSSGKIWLGTPKGIRIVDNDSIKRTSIQDEVLQEKPIVHLTWFHERLWVQTYENGFYVIKDGNIESLTQSDQSLLYLNQCFVSDDGKIWGRSNRKPTSLVSLQVVNDSIILENYAFDDLASGHLYNIDQLIVKKGMVYLGTRGGLFQTPIDKLVKEGQPPKAYVTRVSANYTPLPKQERYTLPFEENSVAMEFDAISFRLNPIEFRCRLQGLDSVWVRPPFQGLQYTNLSPGEYLFQVQSRFPHESWGPIESIHFHIQTPYWQTWWFRLFFGQVIASIIGGIFHLWSRAQRKRAALEIEALKAEQKALRAQMNPHFVYNALNSAQNFLLLGNTTDYNLFMSRLGELMRSGLEHSDLAFIPLNQEIRFLENYLSLETQRFPNRFTYKIDIHEALNEISDVVSLPPLMIQPLCENAIKHAYDDTPVEIVLSLQLKKENTLWVQVSDNGIGYIPHQREVKGRPSFGLSILDNRIQLLQKQGFEASCNITYLNDDLKRGTKVLLKLPLK